uniref:Uncharacterized protein n=1 Tax=Lithodesmium undulatum TaxID=59812 RepID=A0A7T6UZP5_LITUN|nr:hypothetical protein KYV41_mgp06 [Lithodesmium undulatum]QQJ94665.1 hypothetical protein [Lithodesmium undulatum]
MIGNVITKVTGKHMDDAASKEIVDLIKTHKDTKDVSVGTESAASVKEIFETNTPVKEELSKSLDITLIENNSINNGILTDIDAAEVATNTAQYIESQLQIFFLKFNTYLQKIKMIKQTYLYLTLVKQHTPSVIYHIDF